MKPAPTGIRSLIEVKINFSHRFSKFILLPAFLMALGRKITANMVQQNVGFISKKSDEN